MRAVLDGSFGDGARLAQQALAYGKRADAPNAEQVYALHGALLLWHQGRLAEDEATVRQAADRYPALPIWRCLLALVACEREREDEARQLVEQLARGRFAGLPRDVFWLCNMALLSEACARLGNAGHAGMLYQHLAPYATRNVMAGRAACLGSVARYLGLLAATRGDRSASARHFEDALAALGRMGARPLDARTRYDYAAMLLGSDTVAASDACVEKGLALLEQARASARELGMPSLAQRAQRLEDDVSASRSPCRSSFPDRLTAREVTVLRLLATGHSNPQIASELVISVKTVERHTVNIYAKIGARNRVDAATYALRHSLV
jgi:ATP/maltotriose-dependent transcriptional regulator MalT